MCNIDIEHDNINESVGYGGVKMIVRISSIILSIGEV